jgi:diguanylate cyclase (GGDEF)-like protein
MSNDSVAYDALIQFLYQAPIGLLQTELDGQITMINPMAASLLMPLTRDGDLSNLFDVLEPCAPELRAQASAHAEHGEAVGDRILPIPVDERHRPGRPPATLGLRLVRLDAQTWMATISDITQAVHDEEQQVQKRLHDLSRSDGLTGLPNRTVASEHIESARAQAAASHDGFFAIAFIDLDRFHRVNTTRGQSAGDLLLQRAADRLARLAAPGGEIETLGARGLLAARLGADEFVVVAHQVTHRDVAAQLAKAVVDALGEPYAIDHQPEHVSASVGVVLGQRDAGSTDSLMLDASLAMGEAKRAGGARFSLFEPAMRARAARRATIETDLRGAIERGALTVAYQPIVSLASRRCVGMEALVRWQHPLLGNVPPLEFVEVAEDIGLISELGRFVMDEACRACAAWQQQFGAGAPRSVSVNVSRAQLLGSDHIEHVRTALASSGLNAAALQVEVTESLAAQDDRVRRSLHELKALGITVALDDFGTGYSSLATLHLLPIDVLKIDQSFVRQVEHSDHHGVLIEAVILVARSLNMRTVAEGIETDAQADALTRLQCDKGQGYLFARPLSREAMTAWLDERMRPGGSP